MNLLVHLSYLGPLRAAVLILFGFAPRRTAGGYQCVSALQMVPAWDRKFYVGVDGLNATMLLLTSLVALAAAWMSPRTEENLRRYMACLMAIAAGAAGAFASLDLFFFYAFHELALIPPLLILAL